MAEIQSKILDLPALADTVKADRSRGKRIVHCHGVFDLLHIGHIRHFMEARAHGDVLVVTITADQYVNKGPSRPAFGEQLRAEALAALECIDYVAVNQSESAIPAIEAVRPDFYVKGKEYRDRPKQRGGKLAKEETTVKEFGGSMVFTDDITFSSSALINNHFSPFPAEVSQYLRDIAAQHPPEYFEEYFDRIRKLKVLVVGETIIDEYHYCEAIGKAGKEPVLVSRSLSSEKFAGGILAIANNMAGFCAEVGVLSFLGSRDSHEDFIRARLKANVKLHKLVNRERPTIVKLRYVEQYLLQKLFEVYTIDDEPLGPDDEADLCAALESELANYDVVVVADYGHGMLSEKAIDLLCSKSRFLAVNTQANAGNRGFHTISMYPKADYISISEGELRLDMRRRKGEPQKMVEEMLKRRNYGMVTVTRGKCGILCYSKERGFASAPALTEQVVDRIGSGDAVLAVTSLFAALKAPPDVLALIGNVAGAEAVRIVGHRSFLEYSPFVKHLTSLLR